jgi:lysophospholipase L1-like esterase
MRPGDIGNLNPAAGAGIKKIGITLMVLLSIAIGEVCSQPYKIPDEVKRIVFLGNSITYNGLYVSYIDAYLTLEYRDKNYEIINVGLPSETVSGLSEAGHAGGAFSRPDLHERLARVLEGLHPDLVFAGYGMNDGIYLPFNEERFKLFRAGMIRLHNEVEKAGAHIIHLTPAVYDPRKGAAYANVLDIYSDWLISKRYTDGWKVIDIHSPMKCYLKDRRLQDSTFALARDGIHPGPVGHYIMAKSILKGLGEDGLASDDSMAEALSFFPQSDSLLKLVEKRQVLLKDGWLTHIGHKRPGMAAGLPVAAAEQKADSLRVLIHAIIGNIKN